jgi:hypothetical protein
VKLATGWKLLETCRMRLCSPAADRVAGGNNDDDKKWGGALDRGALSRTSLSERVGSCRNCAVLEAAHELVNAGHTQEHKIVSASQ